MNAKKAVSIVTISFLVFIFGNFASIRFVRAGTWLPPAPGVIGHWEASQLSVSKDVLARLGNPPASEYVYRNPFAEEVRVSMVAAGPFENYHDPTVCVGGPRAAFRLTAKRTFKLDSAHSGEVRAMLFKHRTNPKIRIVMYYWQQNHDGTTDWEPRMGNIKDIAARIKTGYGAVIQGKKTVIFRIYAMFEESDDPDGVRAQDNVNEISGYIYKELLKDKK